ncbi:3-oxoacyl-ACP synthase III family protein [Anaerovibrio slackiae]|uniref:3-oxoacyl-ACP synthase III family protein n=1 Tax=Anaerovibrio slackiae TaxID=2652309 RepID=UPI003F13FF56
MYLEYKNVAIRAIASAAPTRILDNEKFAESISDNKYKRRIKYTGIKQRRVVQGMQRTSDLACIAAENILDKLSWERNSIGFLIFITQNPDLYAPSTAMLIQTKLGLSQDLMAFDINLGCSGFTTGIQVMSGLLSEENRRGLVLMGDCQHYRPGTEFESNSILFGDGGAAVALEYEDATDVIKAFQMTDGSRFKALCCTYDTGHIMDGNEIVLFSLNEVVNSINKFSQKCSVSADDVDFFALHQAQKIIVDGVANNCFMPKDKVLEAYQFYGNTSSASIPFALCANTNLYQKEVLRILACGFGIGLAWSGVLFSVNAGGILPIIESDYTYPRLF